MPTFKFVDEECFVKPLKPSFSYDPNKSDSEDEIVVKPIIPVVKMKTSFVAHIKFASDDFKREKSFEIESFKGKLEAIKEKTKRFIERRRIVLQSSVQSINEKITSANQQESTQHPCLETFQKQNLIARKRLEMIKQLHKKESEAKEPKEGKNLKEIKEQKPKKIEKKEPISRIEETISNVNMADYERPEAERIMGQMFKIAETILQNAEQATKDPNVKTEMLQHRMKINRSVGQICDSAKQVVGLVVSTMHQLSAAWSNHGALMLDYCFRTLANKVIEQAETQVMLHQPSAFPLAQFCVELGANQQNFLPTLIYLMSQRCPYIVPRYILRRPQESDHDFRLRQGYASDEETEQAFFERMYGIVSLYGAIIQTIPLRKGLENPYGITNGWTWIATIMNLPPRPITAGIICSFLDSCGYRLVKRYNQNFIKLMGFLKQNIISRMPPESIASKTRLELYLDEFLKFANEDVEKLKPIGMEISRN